MDHEVGMIIRQALVGGTFLSALALVLFAVRRKSHPVASRELASVAERLERIEQAVDTIAVEIERVSEAQRFTSKLLAEKAGDAALPKPPARQITPH